MNRHITALCTPSAGVPHACGDEPEAEKMLDDEIDAFPTPVGMNRIDDNDNAAEAARSPRLWG